MKTADEALEIINKRIKGEEIKNCNQKLKEKKEAEAEEKKKIKIKIYAGDDELSKKIYEQLFSKTGDYNQATELMVQDILKKEKISTLRHDEKPEVWIYHGGIYIPQGKSYIQQRCRAVLGMGYYRKFFQDVLEKILTETYIDEKEFFNESSCKYIPLNNGILDLEEMKLFDFSTRFRFFSKIPINYNPKQTCPKIIQFLKDILENEEDLKVIQECFGFLLVRDYFIEKSFMFNGLGRNGKTKLLDLIKRFLGADNCVEIPLHDLERDLFAVSELHKKLVNVSGDLSDEGLKNTGNFKKITGRDLISAPRKFLTRISFVNYSKQIFACNRLPRTKDLSPAFFLRWVILNFPYTFLPQKEINQLSDNERRNIKLQNPHIIDEITSEEELSGLLNWGLIGLIRLRENKDFSFSKTTAEVQNDWLRKSNSVEGFIMDKCKLEYGEGISKEDFLKAYSKYCFKNKLKIETEKTIKETLDEKGIYDTRKKINDEQRRFWIGISLK